MSSSGSGSPAARPATRYTDAAPIRRHAATPHRLRGQHRARWTAEFAPFLEGTHKRYAAVLGAAVVGASTVAFSSAAALPDSAPESAAGEAVAEVAAQAAESEDRSSREGESEAEKEEAEREPEPAATAVDYDTSAVPRSPMQVQAPEVHWVPPLDRIMITSQFGPRWGTAHNGVDFDAQTGDPVYAIYPGRIVTSGWEGGFGNLVVVDHGDGLQTYYAHNSELIVSPGQWVDAGQQIAKAGNTGFSLGSHVHLEVHQNGSPVEPLSFLQERGLFLR
ncbi:M23 family metallopeptidase [Salininema proteolyticum]|uniref:M23 family metallopeptidase n=1 Tax=Salininema proteolyticum TaxID=1607685 RepID=A0ABV8U2I8_9ACTN